MSDKPSGDKKIEGKRKLLSKVKEVPVQIADDDSIQGVYLERFIEASENLRVELRAATPAWAQEKLDNNKQKNRKLSKNQQERIRQVIKDDLYEVNGDTIVFDDEDNIVNGFHRLTEIAACEKTVPVLVVYGVPNRVFVTFDQQKKRNASDILSMEDLSNTNVLSTALGWYKAFKAEQPTNPNLRRVFNEEVLNLNAEVPDMIASVLFAKGEGKGKLIPPGILTFLHWRLAGINKELAETMLKCVQTGVDVASGSHLHLLRRRLDGMSVSRSQNDQVLIAALIIKTWNRMLRHEPPGSTLVWIATEKFPVILED